MAERMSGMADRSWTGGQKWVRTGAMKTVRHGLGVAPSQIVLTVRPPKNVAASVCALAIWQTVTAEAFTFTTFDAKPRWWRRVRVTWQAFE